MGKRWAEQLANPSWVIDLSVSRRYLCVQLVMSVGVHHLIEPFQYAGTDVFGVPPLMIRVKSPSRFNTPA
jgi:hypothetical protein